LVEGAFFSFFGDEEAVEVVGLGVLLGAGLAAGFCEQPTVASAITLKQTSILFIYPPNRFVLEIDPEA
jgi:hypothetical protein